MTPTRDELGLQEIVYAAQDNAVPPQNLIRFCSYRPSDRIQFQFGKSIHR